MARDRYRVYEADHAYFLTCTIVGWIPVLARPETFHVVYDAWSWLSRQQRLEVFAYVMK